MDRRRFLQLFGGGVVATATMAEAGFLADFMAWIKRMPAWSIPKGVSAYNFTSPSLARLAAIYYDKRALDALKTNFVFYELAGKPSTEFGVDIVPTERGRIEFRSVDGSITNRRGMSTVVHQTGYRVWDCAKIKLWESREL